MTMKNNQGCTGFGMKVKKLLQKEIKERVNDCGWAMKNV
jgi:hypothetical protein